MCHPSAFKIERQNILSALTLNSWNKEFPIGSLYEGISSQKFSVLLVSQARCLIMGQSDLGSPWDETSYGKDCGHRYSFPGVDCKNSGNWNGAVFARNVILSAAL